MLRGGGPLMTRVWAARGWGGLFCFKFNFYFILQLIYSVVLVSGVQQSDSVIHIHISILFQILFP